MVSGSRILVSITVMALIVLPIALSIASLQVAAESVDGTVYVVVSRAFVEQLKREYALGALFISMGGPAPGSYRGYSFHLGDVAGERLKLDFKSAARAWDEFYKSDLGRKILEVSPTLPTVSITVTLYKGDMECIALYTYNAIDYFVERGLPLPDAMKKAGEDPLAHLRRPLMIVLKSKMPRGEVKVECVDLSPILEELKRTLDEKHGLKIQEREQLETAITQQSCPTMLESVWWTDLYNSRDSPPEGWYRNIFHPNRDIPNDIKLRAWRFYAERYSKAYYWLASRYSLEEAIRATDSMLGLAAGEGIRDMDGWIHMIITRSDVGGGQYYGVQWKDYPENYGYAPVVTGNIPYLGVYIENPNNKPIRITGSFFVDRDRYYKKGFTVAGIIVLGDEVRSNIQNSVGIAASAHKERWYATMWTVYYYDSDAMLVKYDVKEVRLGGCSYWRVVPTSAIIPKYSVVLDLSTLDATTNPDKLSSVMYSTRVDTVYTKVISNVAQGTILFKDNNTDAVSHVRSSARGSIMFNLFLDMVTFTFTNLLCGGHIACAIFGIIIGALLNYANEDLEDIALGFNVRLETFGYVNYATVQVDKITLWATEAYTSIGWRPVLVEYRVYVDTGGGGAPCIEYCPYASNGFGSE